MWKPVSSFTFLTFLFYTVACWSEYWTCPVLDSTTKARKGADWKLIVISRVGSNPAAGVVLLSVELGRGHAQCSLQQGTM